MGHRLYKLRYKYIDLLIFLYKLTKNISPKISKRLEKNIINKTLKISNEFYNDLVKKYDDQ